MVRLRIAEVSERRVPVAAAIRRERANGPTGRSMVQSGVQSGRLPGLSDEAQADSGFGKRREHGPCP